MNKVLNKELLGIIFISLAILSPGIILACKGQFIALIIFLLYALLFLISWEKLGGKNDGNRSPTCLW